MSSRSDSKSDLLQILVFTFFLCAIFFGSWGGYLHWKVGNLKRDRAKEERTINWMQEQFLEDQNRENVERYLREQEMRKEGEGGTGLALAIQKVLNGMPSRVRPKIESSRSGQSTKGNVLELEYSLNFEPTQLDYLIQFISQLESDRPDIDITRFSVSRKRARGSGGSTGPPEDWATDTFRVVTQVSTKSS